MGELVPTIPALPARYRGASSSDDMNAVNRAAYNDIVNAYQALAAQKAQTDLDNEVLAVQNVALSQQLSTLESQLSTLQQVYSQLTTLKSSTSGGTVSLSAPLYSTPVSYGGFSAYPSLSAPSRAVHAPIYGQVTPNISSQTSKAYVIDLLTQQIVYPPSVASAGDSIVSPTLPPFAIEESDIAHAVDGLQDTCWRRNLYFPASTYVSDVTTTLTVTLPEQYVNNLTCNYVTIHPYPEFGVDIVSVVLHGAPGSGDQQLLPVDVAGKPVAIAQAGKTRLLFTPTTAVSIDITLRASRPIYTLKPGLQAFVTGATLVDFGYIAFNQSPSKVLVPFTLSNNFFAQVTGVGPVVDGVAYQLFAVSPTGDLVPLNIGDSPSGFTSTVYVEVTLTPQAGILPVVDALQLQFVPIYLTN